jgi:hypothetical protein
VAHEGPGTMQASAHRPFGHATKSHTHLPGRAPQGGPENAGLLLRTCSGQGPYVGSVPKECLGMQAPKPVDMLWTDLNRHRVRRVNARSRHGL